MRFQIDIFVTLLAISIYFHICVFIDDEALQNADVKVSLFLIRAEILVPNNSLTLLLFADAPMTLVYGSTLIS